MQLTARLGGWWDDLRDSLWLMPGIVVPASIALAAGLVALEPLPDVVPDALVFGGTPEGARAILGELAGATITVTGLVFSLTVIALQMASSQFSPRLLRTFLRDRSTQAVLSGMVGSAVYDVAVLRTVRSAGDGVEPFVPQLAVTVALVYALTVVGLLIFFLHHVTRHMRVDVVMRSAALQTIRRLGTPDRDHIPDREPADTPATADVVTAGTGGYLQTVRLSALGDRARHLGIRVRLRPAVGTWVTKGTVLAWWWPEGSDDELQLPDPDEVAAGVHGAIHLGPDRTESDDVAYGVRQLVDIALRALSTGVNDPTTGVQAVDQISAVLAAAAGHPLGVMQDLDDDGSIRAELPRETFPALLALGVDEVRAAGRQDTEVVVALLGLCTDLGELVADHADRRRAVEVQVERIVDAAEIDDDGDRQRIERAAELARATLASGRRPPTVTEAG